MALRSAPVRVRLLRPIAVAVGALGALGLLAQLPTTSAAFTASTAAGISEFDAAASWCTAPGSTTLSAQQDSMVVQSSPNANYGQTSPLQVRARTGDVRRMLVRPVLPTIPPGCTLTGATLRLSVVSYQPARTYVAQRISSSWTLTGVTWSNQPSTAGATTTAPTASGSFSIDVTPQVQGLYAAGVTPNHGIALRDSNEETSATFTNSFSSLNGPVDPTVTYTWA